jgi:hypothetical protein
LRAGSPMEGGIPGQLTGIVSEGSDLVWEISVVRSLATPDLLPAVTLSFQTNGPNPDLIDAEYPVGLGGDIVGPTISGHAGAPAVIGVGAISVLTPTTIEEFSSLGPVEYVFGPEVAGGPAASPLAETQVIDKPNVLGFDGNQTSFFEGPSAPYRFYGTSSASPTVAAVVALALELAPGTTSERIRDLLPVTAQGVPNPYGLADADVVGAGSMDALALLTALRPVEPAVVPTLAETGSEVVGAAALAALLMGGGAVLVLLRARRRERGFASEGPQ